MPHAGSWQFEASASADPKEMSTMKRSLRALLLLVGLVGTFAYAAVPKVPTRSGPVPLCDPWRDPNCSY
jgi:hypothetical protein